MAAEKFDFSEFLAVLEAKRAALDTLIYSYRQALSLGALGQPEEAEGAGGVSVGGTATVHFNGRRTSGSVGTIDLPQGALLGMSLPAAIKLYLSAARRKQTTREVTTALKEHGIESTAQNFENTVTTALHRLKTAGDVLKFNDGWALAEFYPENLRLKIAAKTDQKATKKATTKSRKRAPKKQGRVLAITAGEEPKAVAG